MTTRSDVSPPPSKRRRIDTPHTTALAPTLPTRPITPLQPTHFRVFTWNVNGIAPFLQTSITSFFETSSLRKRPTTLAPGADKSRERPPADLRAYLRRWKWPHILCLQEVKIAPTDIKTRQAVQRAVKAASGSDEPSYKAFYSLPRDQYNARGFGGKVYGVAMLVRDDSLGEEGGTATATPVDWDLEGRVQVLELRKRGLVVVNVYAVNGTENPYKDPKTGEVVGTRHDHKRAFHTRLQGMIREYEQHSWTVIVSGDINVARGPVDGFPGIRLAPAHVQNRRDFDEKFMKPPEIGSDGLGMVDSFRALHGDERKYTYRSPSRPWGISCDRVDLILLTSNATKHSDALLEADVLDEESERGSSDHLPSYVTIDLDRLLRNGDIKVKLPEAA